MTEAYDQGREAAAMGKEFWENPYSQPSGPRGHFNAWFAGWCFGKKMKEELRHD